MLVNFRPYCPSCNEMGLSLAGDLALLNREETRDVLSVYTCPTLGCSAPLKVRLHRDDQGDTFMKLWDESKQTEPTTWRCISGLGRGQPIIAS